MITSQDREVKPSLAVPSQLAAHQAAKIWMAANNFEAFSDLQQQTWSVNLKVKEAPDVTMKTMVNKLQISLNTTYRASDIIAHGLLNPTEDARMLRLIGDATIPMFMTWKEVAFANHQDLRDSLQDKLPKIKTFMQSVDLTAQKIRNIHLFIENRMAFTLRR